MTCLLGLLLAVQAAAGTAKNPKRATARPPRIHIITPLLRSHLAAQTLRNEAAVAEYKVQIRPGWNGVGTAFLVHRSGDRGIVLTNAHNWSAEGGKMSFPDDKNGEVVRPIVINQKMDYALIAIKFPQGNAPEPVRLSERTPGKGERVYAISGFGNVAGLVAETVATDGHPEKYLASNRFNRDALEAHQQGGGIRTIVAGRVTGARTNDIFKANKLESRIRGVSSNLHTLRGNSGSPVFSSTTHEAVALHVSGADGSGFHIPMKSILQDLRAKLQRGEIPSEDLNGVQALLQ